MIEIQEILKKYWGYDSFRPGQEEAIRSVLSGNDTLLLLPTGGGKSICFQVPALALGKLCIVVTPLIALMKDQVDQLKKRGIRAYAIYSGMNNKEIDIILDNCAYGQVSFLYVSPERLGTPLMIERTKKMKVGLIAVDEAHCISQWGYDFRPSYLKIAEFRVLLPNVPIVAVTASATETVQNDILEKLVMPAGKVFRKTFARDNLSYSAFKTESKETKLVKLLQSVSGSIIIYVKTRGKTTQIANWLLKSNISASAYHAGLSPSERSKRQQAWISDQIRVMVATNAFGMGIDKANVRAVVHWDLPESLEAYYQEAGRAGRDGKKAYALALYNDHDLARLKASVDQKYPSSDLTKRVYQALSNFLQVPIGSGQFEMYSFDFDKFAETYDLPRSETFYAVRLLEQEGFILLNEAFNNPSRARLLIDKMALYDFQLRNINYDPFIKRLLRFHGGEIFTNYVPISESTLASSLKCPVADIYKGFEFLAARGIIDYQRQTDLPRIQFMTPRYDASKLPLDTFSIKKRQERDTAKVDAVVHYASHPAQCRSIMLLQYFDEHDASYCDICDHCLQRKKNRNTEVIPEFNSMITNYLTKHGKTMPSTLKTLFPNMDTPTFTGALHELIESETLTYDQSGNLQLSSLNP